MYSNGAVNLDKHLENGLLNDTKQESLYQLQPNSEDSEIQLLHKQETTRQITTVTKVVREVQHLPEECMVDYVTMPFQHPAEMDMSLGMGPQFLYANSAKHGSGDQANVCGPDGNDFNTQFAGLEELAYPSSHLVKKSSSLAMPHVGPQCNYSGGMNACSVIGSQDQLVNSAQGMHISEPRRYLQAAQFTEISDYGLNAADGHYAEDPAVTYGYVPDPNFALSNANSCSRQMLFSDSLNAPSDENARLFEMQNKMANLKFNTLEGPQMGVNKDEMIDGNGSDICSTLRWRDPNLAEVISFLNNPNNAIKANAAAYLQHLCYMDDPNKQRTRNLGGIPPLVRLLAYDIPEIHKNACGALRNLSYGRQNDENKRVIKNAGGITALVNLLCRTQDSEVRELVTGVLWNMSSCEDIKRAIIDEGLIIIVNNIIKPHSGWDPVCPGDTCFSTVFRNASGVLRNVSSAGEYARTSLRNSEHLVECLLYVVRMAIEKNNIGNKTVENCVCILRNLSYRCQEIEDPNYDKQPFIPCRVTASSSKGENLGCFGTNKRKKDSSQNEQVESTQTANSSIKSSSGYHGVLKGYERLWQPEVVQYYLALLQTCSNPETLEAAAGAIQNLSACYWQPSIDIRATVRKEKGLPILVELLRMEVDRVVCAVATALRNLAIDQRNKELIGKYAMRDLVQKLPSGNPQHDQNTSDDTISAVLATINEVIKKNPEFARSLLDAGGVERLMNITRYRQKYTSCVLKFASQVLFTMWQHHELRDVYKKSGWKEQDFVSKSLAAQNTSPHSPNNMNNTLNRPMASQGRTRYEDRTIQRGSNSASRNGAGGQHATNETAFTQQGHDAFANGVKEENYQQDGQNLAIAMYTPVENGRNHSK